MEVAVSATILNAMCAILDIHCNPTLNAQWINVTHHAYYAVWLQQPV